MRVYLEATGCRLNQSEIEMLARQFQRAGHELVGEASQADLCVVNTCAVTAEGARSSRNLIRRIARANPAISIVPTGCYAQIAPEVVAALPGVSRVIDNQQKDRLVSVLLGQDEPDEPYEQEPLQRDLLPGLLGRTRTFVKVQDGCKNRCTFCVTAIARGRERSRSADVIVQEIAHLTAQGYPEAVLTGVHLGAYGRDQGERDGLARLVRRILNETPVRRLRLSSLEPWDLDTEFFALWDDPRLCRHLHLPLQSGCDATLRRMGRRTSQAAFRALVEHLRSQIPDVAITTDIIVGFPGETEAEFEESLAFVRALGCLKLHVFRYSRRPGTAAARMPGQVPPEVARERSARMLAVSEEGAQHFYARFIGRSMPVLWEQVAEVSEAGFCNTGLTDNYIRVDSWSPQVLTGTIVSARLERVAEAGMIGALEPGP